MVKRISARLMLVPKVLAHVDIPAPPATVPAAAPAPPVPLAAALVGPLAVNSKSAGLPNRVPSHI